jgi:hypothetical protein
LLKHVFYAAQASFYMCCWYYILGSFGQVKNNYCLLGKSGFQTFFFTVLMFTLAKLLGPQAQSPIKPIRHQKPSSWPGANLQHLSSNTTQVSHNITQHQSSWEIKHTWVNITTHSAEASDQATRRRRHPYALHVKITSKQYINMCCVLLVYELAEIYYSVFWVQIPGML